MHCTERSGFGYICLYHELPLSDGTGSSCISKARVKEGLKLHLSTFTHLTWGTMSSTSYICNIHAKILLQWEFFLDQWLYSPMKKGSRGISNCSGSNQLFLLGWIGFCWFEGFLSFFKGWKPMRIKVHRIHGSWKLIPMNCDFLVYWYYLNSQNSSSSSWSGT